MLPEFSIYQYRTAWSVVRQLNCILGSFLLHDSINNAIRRVRGTAILFHVFLRWVPSMSSRNKSRCNCVEWFCIIFLLRIQHGLSCLLKWQTWKKCWCHFDQLNPTRYYDIISWYSHKLMHPLDLFINHIPTCVANSYCKEHVRSSAPSIICGAIWKRLFHSLYLQCSCTSKT